ncbi:hypothetical protein FRC07_014306, partial [Ceratobasidium sp. 392]
MPSTTFANASLQWADAVVDSVHFSKCMMFLAAIMRQGEGGIFSSPYILERKFRLSVEIGECKSDPMYKDGFYLKDLAIYSLVDALLQVREVVNLFTNGLEEAETAENFCARTSPLYVPLLLSGIHFPHEPDFGFTVKDWHKVYPNLSDLIVDVVRLQIWGLWTIVALHCFVAAQGKHKSPEDQRRLPPFPGALLTIGESVMEAWCNDGYSQAPPPLFPFIPIMVGSEMAFVLARTIQKKAEEEENANLALVPYAHKDLPTPPASPSLSASDSIAPATPPTELDEEEEYMSAEECKSEGDLDLTVR